ncbi:SDR family NAD(P)-dependent oxidoreductase [Aeromicrobium sp. Leaf350]|uniref:SDR family NAD(P)-dependent oxidoreductase n=1 Tax=Aeromicrobium sp. Leaf350 TaxID=2876565 RepID=UPI001E30F037|nr:SDR family NAD(P)-dependent oxidoreductase [Aeromicrobium sp. Leaf350]
MSRPSPVLGALDAVLDKVVPAGYSSIGPALRRRWWPADPPAHALVGKHVLVTGASRGLGLAAATDLARLGAVVHLLGRDQSRLDEAAAGLRLAVPNADVRPETCDVSDLDAVRAYATRTLEQVPALHALIHNAGVMPEERSESAQGIELTLATHVVGPLLLTELLRPALAAADDSRVLIMSSGGMYSAPLNAALADDLQYREGTYRGIRAYARTKRLQVLLGEQLATRLAGDGVVVHSMHPGWAATEGIAESMPGFARAIRPILRDARSGADTLVWLTAAPEATATTGLFWSDRHPRSTTYLPWTTEDPVLRRKVWDAVAALAGIDHAPA